eukprot:TRINITY_DN3366_c0_g1_i1.p1 TRINITY_DN3366_c0_g1~~TRINITY_DN3366_c0_g1_i1.p1  ORF type:complete len:2025 (+),score=227.56 TRINITY_DN3366_c0_g1_i1:830-6076(+)
MLTRLARHAFENRARRKLACMNALDTYKRLRELGTSLDRQFRTVRVSGQVLVEEAFQISKRVSSLTARRYVAQQNLDRLARRKQALEARIAAVDALFAPDFARAQGSVDAALRDLSRLENHHYAALWNYLHAPPPLIRTLELMHTVVAYLSWLDREEAARKSSSAGDRRDTAQAGAQEQTLMSIEQRLRLSFDASIKSSQSEVTKANLIEFCRHDEEVAQVLGVWQLIAKADEKEVEKKVDDHFEKMSSGADAVVSWEVFQNYFIQEAQTESHLLTTITSKDTRSSPIAAPPPRYRRGGREELDALRSVVATKDLLPQLRAWPTRRRMPAWLAAVIKQFSADPECSQAALREIAPVVAGMAAWLLGRLECHDVLVQMEAKCTSMGDLSHQMVEMKDELLEATRGFNRLEADLEDLKSKHTTTVQRRDEQGKVEKQLQDQVRRVQYISSAFATRYREYEIRLQQLEALEGSISEWGGLVSVAVLCVYSSPFNPVIRSSLAKETRSVLQQFNIGIPKHFHADDYLKRYLPHTFVDMAKAHWQDRYLYESVCALELQSARCAVVLDPFEEALSWLRLVHAKQSPPRPHGLVAPSGDVVKPPEPKRERGKHMWRRAAEPTEGEGLFDVSDCDEEADGAASSAFADSQVDDGEVTKDDTSLKVIVGGLPPAVVLEHVKDCILKNRALVIQLQALSQLHGFIGTLLVLLQSVESIVSLRSGDTSAHLRVGCRRETETGSKLETSDGAGHDASSVNVVADVPPEVQLFGLLQQLRFDLALPYRRFRLYVLVPELPWNSLVVSALRKKRAELAVALPGQLWSLCNMVSLDTRPVHPVHVFLQAFRDARSLEASRVASGEKQMRFMLLRRLELTEDILLHLLAQPRKESLDGQRYFDAVQRRISRADHYSKLLASCSEDEASDRVREKDSRLAGTVAVILCAMIEWQQFRRGNIGSDSYNDLRIVNQVGSRLDANVSGFTVGASVLYDLLLHQLRSNERPERAVARLLEMVMHTSSPRQATILKVCLVLESGLLHDPQLTSIWEGLLRSGAGAEELAKSGVGGAQASKGDGSKDVDRVAKDKDGASGEQPNTPEAEFDAARGSMISEGIDDSDHEGGEAPQAQNVDDEERDLSGSDFEEAGGDADGGGRHSDDGGSMTSGSSGESHDKVEAVVTLSRTMNDDGTVRRLISELCDYIDTTYPRETYLLDVSPHEFLRHPAGVPFLVIFDAIPKVVEIVRGLGYTARFETPEFAGENSTDHGWTRILRDEGAWLFVDLADVINFGALFAELRQFREALQSAASVLPRVNRVRTPKSDGPKDTSTLTNVFKDNGARLVLYSSSEFSEIPTYILAQCVCVQNPFNFFFRSAGQGEKKGKESSTHHYTHLLDSPYMKALSQCLSHTHPLLTNFPMSMQSDGYKSILTSIQETISGETGFVLLREVMLNCAEPSQVTQWVDREVIAPSLGWMRQSAIRSMLFHGFSPTLIRQSETEVRETVRVVASELCNLLQRAAHTLNTLTHDSPFWLRAALRKSFRGITTARSDLVACYSVLAGDAHWNEHLFAVYTTVAHGRAIWAGCCPLASWLQSLNANIKFLTEYPLDTTDTVKLRMASITNMIAYISTYWMGVEEYHLRLEPTSAGGGERKTDREKIASRLEHRQNSRATIALGEVEGLCLLASTSSSKGGDGAEHELQLPPMLLRANAGPPPRGSDWFECPLLIVRADAYGSDVVGKPIARVMVKTSANSTLCALRGMRVLSYA